MVNLSMPKRARLLPTSLHGVSRPALRRLPHVEDFVADAVTLKASVHLFKLSVDCRFHIRRGYGNKLKLDYFSLITSLVACVHQV